MPVVNETPAHRTNHEDTAVDWDALDCQKMLGTWLGELEELTGKLGLEEHGGSNVPQMRDQTLLQQPRIDSYRFSQANLEDSLEFELDEILGELSALGTQFDAALSAPQETDCVKQQLTRKLSGGREYGDPHKRTDSPDNDSAFSDSLSMLSSESSASSGASGARTDCSKSSGISMSSTQMDHAARIKAEKIKLALEKIKEANIQKLFIKAFTKDGSAKSLLIDETMTVAQVTRTLADKNHVTMDPNWAIVEYLPDLYMERIYEDHEHLVRNMLLWANNSSNKIYFSERFDKYDLFVAPEQYLLSGSSSEKGHELTDEEKHTLLEEFFSSTGVGVPEIEGSLFLKAEGKKAWKRHHFVLRASGLYYCPKGKSSRSSKDLVCLAATDVNQVYYGVGWKKKYKAPTEYCFAIKHPSIQSKNASKYFKYLCAEDERTLRQWVMGIRIAKHGKQLRENYRNLLDDLAQEDIDRLAHARSFSVVSMTCSGRSGSSNATTPSSDNKSFELCISPEREERDSSSGSTQATPVNTLDRRRRPTSRQDSVRSKSSSSSSGCLSERSGSGTPTWEHGFDSDFPMGTIKRKPSITPKLPLTNTTRLLVKEVEDVVDGDLTESGDLVQRNSLRQSTRKSLSEEIHSYRRKSQRCAEIMKDSLPLPPPPEFGDNLSDNESLPPPPSDMMSSSTLSIDSLPPPPPPIFSDDDHGSMLSLNSLPPPPSPLPQPSPPPAPKELGRTTSLPPPPDPDLVNKLQPSHYGTSKVLTKPPRRASEDTGIYGSGNPPPFLSELKAHTSSSPKLLRRTGSCLSGSSQNSSSTTETEKISSPTKKGRKISFDDGISPRKPSPPKRSESTRLSQSPSPKKLSSPGSTVTPPQEFLQHLQRVMQRKCSVAQRLKLEPDSTAHEVLGFRDHNVVNDLYENQRAVGAWIQEHYGGDNMYDTSSPLYDTARYPPPPVYDTNKQPNVQQPLYETNKQPLYDTGKQPLYDTNKQPLYDTSKQPLYDTGKQPLYETNNQPLYDVSKQQPLYDKQPVYDTSKPPVIYARRNSEGKRRPPPPPPKRSESTQLSTRLH